MRRTPSSRSGSGRRLKWSPDGTMIAAAWDTVVVVWDADSGALLYADEPDPARSRHRRRDLLPDSELLIATSNDARAASSPPARGRSSPPAPTTAPPGVGRLHPRRLEAARRQPVDGQHRRVAPLVRPRRRPAHPLQERHPRRVRAVGGAQPRRRARRHRRLRRAGACGTAPPSNSCTRFRSATPDPGRRLRRRRPPRRHPQEGNLLLVTIDPDELLDIVRRSLTRGFTATECALRLRRRMPDARRAPRSPRRCRQPGRAQRQLRSALGR